MNEFIRTGDWIIREAPDDQFEDNYDIFDNPMLRQRPRRDDGAFTDHAVYVLDVGKAHVTIYEPLMGRPLILQWSNYEGEWHQATERQVDVTWDMAMMHRDRSQAFNIQAERARFPYRRRTARLQ